MAVWTIPNFKKKKRRRSDTLAIQNKTKKEEKSVEYVQQKLPKLAGGGEGVDLDVNRIGRLGLTESEDVGPVCLRCTAKESTEMCSCGTGVGVKCVDTTSQATFSFLTLSSCFL